MRGEPLPQAAVEKLRALKLRVGRQRKMLRAQNESLARRNLQYELIISGLRQQLKDRADYARRVDYRSVCRCYACRFREWYRYRSGETYPGDQRHPRYQYRWRLPFRGRWPLWR